MSDRPLADAAEELSRLPGLAARETDAVAGSVRDETLRVAAMVREAGRLPGMSGVADEIAAMAQQAEAALAGLSATVGRVVEAEVTQLRELTAPPAQSSVPAPGSMPDLSGVPTFRPQSRQTATHDAQPVGHGAPSGRVVEFTTEAEFNAAATTPEPDTTYRFRDVEWRTDHLGRTISVIGKPRLESATRDPRLQATIGREGRASDVGFHLLGHALGGPTNRVNVVSGNGVRIEDGLANLNQGAYKRFENEIRRHLKAGHDVRVEIQVVYDSRNGTRRPDEFVARLTVDGDRSRPYRFVNK